MALGPIPRGPSGLLGFLQLTNDGRFPSQLSEVVTPTMDYLPFLAEGVGVRWKTNTTADVAPAVLSVQTPPDKFRLCYALGVDITATVAIAEWAARVTYGVGGTNAGVMDVQFLTMASGEARNQMLWFPNPFLVPPSSDFTHVSTVGGGVAVVTLSLLCVEFPA